MRDEGVRHGPGQLPLAAGVGLDPAAELEVARQRIGAEQLEVVAERHPQLALVAEAAAPDDAFIGAADRVLDADAVRVHDQAAGVLDVLARGPPAEEVAAVRQAGVQAHLEPVVVVAVDVRRDVEVVDQSAIGRIEVERQERLLRELDVLADGAETIDVAVRIIEVDRERDPASARHARLRVQEVTGLQRRVAPCLDVAEDAAVPADVQRHARQQLVLDAEVVLPVVLALQVGVGPGGGNRNTALSEHGAVAQQTDLVVLRDAVVVRAQVELR